MTEGKKKVIKQIEECNIESYEVGGWKIKNMLDIELRWNENEKFADPK